MFFQDSKRNIFYKTDDEIELMRHSCLLVAQTHGVVAAHIKPGIKTKELDVVAETFIRDNKAEPSFKGYRGFPASLCISINDQVVHGIPGDYELKEGDIVSVDCGVYANGFHGDSAYTYCLNGVQPEVLALLEVTKRSLYKGIENAVAGKRVGDISFAIQQMAESHHYSIVRELVGHGVGRNLHEAPEIPNYGKRGQGPKLLEGMVIAIEPMVNMGKKEIKSLSDDWTIVTIDGKPSAHFEHTVVVRKNKAEILSSFIFLEEAIKNNTELMQIH